MDLDIRQMAIDLLGNNIPEGSLWLIDVMHLFLSILIVVLLVLSIYYIFTLPRRWM